MQFTGEHGSCMDPYIIHGLTTVHAGLYMDRPCCSTQQSTDHEPIHVWYCCIIHGMSMLQYIGEHSTYTVHVGIHVSFMLQYVPVYNYGWRQVKRFFMAWVVVHLLIVSYLTPDSDLDPTPEPDQFWALPPVRYKVTTCFTFQQVLYFATLWICILLVSSIFLPECGMTMTQTIRDLFCIMQLICPTSYDLIMHHRSLDQISKKSHDWVCVDLTWYKWWQN